MISVMLSLNILVMHVTKIIFFFLQQTRHADYYHSYYNHRDMYVSTIIGIKIVMMDYYVTIAGSRMMHFV